MLPLIILELYFTRGSRIIEVLCVNLVIFYEKISLSISQWEHAQVPHHLRDCLVVESLVDKVELKDFGSWEELSNALHAILRVK